MPPLATRLARLPLAVACLMGLVGAAGATRAAE